MSPPALAVVNNEPEPTPTPAEPDWCPSFEDEFWPLYPRRVARKDAKRAWDRLSQADRIAALLGLIAWRREWLKRGELEYVMYPATYLNGERWTDELPQCSIPMHASHVISEPAKVNGQRVAMPEEVRIALQRIKAKA